jgi:preprotein translocase subunit SecG
MHDSFYICPMDDYIYIKFILWVINAIMVALIAKRKKRSALLWFIFGLFFPITLIIVLFVRPIGKKCPACKKWNQNDAIKCKHCGTEIT